MARFIFQIKNHNCGAAQEHVYSSARPQFVLMHAMGAWLGQGRGKPKAARSTSPREGRGLPLGHAIRIYVVGVEVVRRRSDYGGCVMLWFLMNDDDDDGLVLRNQSPIY